MAIMPTKSEEIAGNSMNQKREFRSVTSASGQSQSEGGWEEVRLCVSEGSVGLSKPSTL